MNDSEMPNSINNSDDSNNIDNSSSYLKGEYQNCSNKCKIIHCELLSVEETSNIQKDTPNKCEKHESTKIPTLYEHTLNTNEMSAKIIYLKELIKNLEKNDKKRIIIQSKTEQTLNTIEEYLKDWKYEVLILNGLIRGEIRQKTIDTFNSTEQIIYILLIEGSKFEGISLNSSDTIIFIDNEIDKEKEAKFIQNFNVSHNISLYHLIMKNNNSENIDEYELKFMVSRFESTNQFLSIKPNPNNNKKLFKQINDISYNNSNDNNPQFPLIINDRLQILSIGNIVFKDKFHAERYIYPNGYCAKRLAPSVKNPNEEVWYLLKIIDEGGSDPIFKIEMENDESIFFQASSPTAACAKLFNNLPQIKVIFPSGPDFYGLSQLSVKSIIEKLDGIEKLKSYKRKNQFNSKRKLTFNAEGPCDPDYNYMINIDDRIIEIKENLVDKNKYFVINNSRQFGKTTTLYRLVKYLKSDYFIFLIDLEALNSTDLGPDDAFLKKFILFFLRSYSKYNDNPDLNMVKPIEELQKCKDSITIIDFFLTINNICEISPKPFVLIIDEIDSFVSYPEVFISFLSISRSQYVGRHTSPTFQSIILSGVRNIDYLRSKIRSDNESKLVNGPWNIAADFDIDMSFSKSEIELMLEQYENDNKTGMDIQTVSSYIHNYTSGQPFLVSKICQIIDEKLSYEDKWSKKGVSNAINKLVNQTLTFFTTMIEEIKEDPNLEDMLKRIIFKGDDSFSINIYEDPFRIAKMFGMLNIENGKIVISNYIIQMVFQYYFISIEKIKNFHDNDLQNRAQYIKNGKLDMEFILKRFVLHFNQIFGSKSNEFIEDNGRRLFMIYLRPIINGTGNFYTESQASKGKRTDLIVDYLGEQHVIVMKINYGPKYINEGINQLVGYLNDLNLDTGYLLIFDFNKNKKTEVTKIQKGNKTIVKAIA